jgi:O-antigen ligase
MTVLQKIIIGINLIILMVYSAYCFMPKQHNFAFIGHSRMIGNHLTTLFVIGLVAQVTQKKDIAKAFWLSMAVVLLIGYGTCVIYG